MKPKNAPVIAGLAGFALAGVHPRRRPRRA
jgi:hypothetical protein